MRANNEQSHQARVPTVRRGNTRAESTTNRSGAILVLAALILVILLVCAAIAVDLGFLRVTRAQLRNASDAAALAAAGTLHDTRSVSEARAAAVQFARLNVAAGKPVELDPASDVIFGHGVYDAATGKWNFVAGQQPYDSVRVVARRTVGSPGGPVGLFFGGFVGKNSLQSAASAVATFLPRDMGFVLDLSSSMNDDSTLARENSLSINNYDCWRALGSPKFGTMQGWTSLQQLSGTPASILSQLNLTNVPYPYPQGSWTEFVSYVQGSVPSRYRNKYGLKTWVDYLLVRRFTKASTPQLSATPEQPVAAVKDGVESMLNYLNTLDTREHVSLSTYDRVGRIERQLTSDLSTIGLRIREVQAGHYNSGTNIGEGIRWGAESLTNSYARPSARKVLIVFSDGRANKPGSRAEARQYALDQARLAAERDITIHSISFGFAADRNLMAGIAKIGHGVHFHIENNSVAQYTRDLEQVLIDISSMRPVVLTQ